MLIYGAIISNREFSCKPENDSELFNKENRKEESTSVLFERP